MKHLLDPHGRRALARVMRRQPLLAFDFDGTLAPIVDRPADASVPEALSRRLAPLSARHPVAIVTGRSVADVRPRLGFAPRFVIGSHGAEDPERPEAMAAPPALASLGAALRAQASVLARIGVHVEDKGLSLALHYRLASDRRAAQETIDALLAGLDPSLRAFGGKCVVNIVAAQAPDKGMAVAALLRRSGRRALVFVGDDVNDEAVFARAGRHWLTVRIGRDEPRSQARFFLDALDEVAAAVDAMLASPPDPGAAQCRK